MASTVDRTQKEGLMAAISVSAQDLSRLRDVLDVTRPEHAMPPEQAMFEVMRLVRELVGCDSAQFHEQDAQDLSTSYLQYVDDDEAYVASPEQLAAEDDEPGVDFFKERWWTSPCSLIERTGMPVVSSTRSWHSERTWAQSPVHLEYLTFDDEIFMGFPTSTFRSLRILLPREQGSPFEERELTLMELLLPHLQPLMRAVVEEAGLEPDPMLTARQREILGLVRLGMPNKRIGRILGISEGTVRKHLENVFERLGVQSRTAAVGVAFGEDAATG
jgi:DNA-binding CsgD family transcriptional regulator